MFRGPNPLSFSVSPNCSVLQLGKPLYLRIRPLAAAPAALCSFNASMSFLHTAAVRVAPYDVSTIVETPARPAISYHAVWIPSDDLGTVSQVKLLFSEVAYAWNSNGTVCFPLTLYYGYATTAGMLNIADSAAVEFTEAFYYQPTISLTIERQSVACFLLVAVRTEGVSSWAFQGSVEMTPFLLTPSNSIKGALSSYRNFVQTYIFLYSPEPTSITLSATKTSSDFRSLYGLAAFSSLERCWFRWTTTPPRTASTGRAKRRRPRRRCK